MGRFLRASPRCILKNAEWLVAIDVVHVIIGCGGVGGGVSLNMYGAGIGPSEVLVSFAARC